MKKLMMGTSFLALAICAFWLSIHYHQLDVRQDQYKAYMKHIVGKAVVFQDFKTRITLSRIVSLSSFIIGLPIVLLGWVDIRRRK